MAHVATRALPLSPLRIEAIADATIGDRLNDAPALSPAASSIPPDLESAYGMISGIVLGLLIWVGLLLPALYVLL